MKQQLKELGFQHIPSLDPEYFAHRDRVGYLLLVQTKKKLRYQLYTINAHQCLETARKAVFGYYVNRAIDLTAALRDSQIDDWEVYFRPNGLYPGLKQTLNELLEDYRSLNTRRSELNPDEVTWAYQVYHPDYRRGFTITSSAQRTEEELIAEFLQLWRRALEAALKRYSILLPTYYLGCRHLAIASKQWMDNDVKKFSILEIPDVSGKTRAEVMHHASLDNFRYSSSYRKWLVKQSRALIYL